MKLKTMNQSSITIKRRDQMYHMGYQKKGKGKFYQIVSLHLENGLYQMTLTLAKIIQIKKQKGLIDDNNHVKYQKSFMYNFNTLRVNIAIYEWGLFHFKWV